MPDTLSAHDAFGHWLSGFCDGEASFNLNVGRRQINSQFCLKLRADELPILEEIRSFWGGIGSLTIQKKRREHWCPSAVYQVGGIRDLPTVIDHFEHFPLRSRKARDFPPWRSGVNLHRHISSLPAIGLGPRPGRASNWTGRFLRRYFLYRDTLHEGRVFREVKAVAPDVVFDEGFRHWLAGFIAAEGCLNLRQRKDGIRAALQIRLRADDHPTLLLIRSFFGGGTICRESNRQGKPVYTYEASSPATNHATVIPFLSSHPLRARKADQVPVWLEAAAICLDVYRRKWSTPTYFPGHGNRRRWLPADLDRMTTLQDTIRKLRLFRQ